MKTSSHHAQFRLFLCLTSMHMLWITSSFFVEGVTSAGALGWVFHIAAWGFYTFLFSFIAVMPAWLLGTLFKRAAPGLAIGLSSAGLMLMKSDVMIYDLYRFHFNGFIWNLVTTRGGLSSLGTSNGTYLSIVLSVALVLAIQIVLWKVSVRYATDKTARRAVIVQWSLIPLLFVVQGMIYGLSEAKNEGAILDTAEVYPYFQRIRMHHLASQLGIHVERQHAHKLSVDTARIRYPLKPVTFSSVAHPPNIMIFAAESLRWDRMTPDIMPNSWHLAQQGNLFTQHYSSGNGTREGLFGLFYGLYGSYWASFLHAQKAPILMDRLQALNYQFDLRTSAKFSYPEFSKTLFANFPLTALHEADEKLSPWQRDEWNATQQMAFLKQRDPQRPFMSFFFFESTHARYDFPPQAVIASPFLGDVNYWGMTRESLKPRIGEFKNRYTNAAHWVDVQIGRVLETLRAQGALDNTIVIITGDHGEEFLEKGNWGHNSTFVEEQTHVPMVVWVPGQSAGEIKRVTSHLDIAPTLLQRLGINNPHQDYALGISLYDTQARDFIVVSDWRTIGVQTEALKYRIPYQQHGIKHYVPTGRHDETLSSDQQSSLTARYQSQLLQAIKNCSLFIASGKEEKQ